MRLLNYPVNTLPAGCCIQGSVTSSADHLQGAFNRVTTTSIANNRANFSPFSFHLSQYLEFAFVSIDGIIRIMFSSETRQGETRQRRETRRDGFQVSRNSVAVGYDRSNSRPTTGNAISKLISIFYLYAPASSRQFYTSAIFRGVYVRPAASSRRTYERIRGKIDRSNRERPITTKRILSIRGTILWPTHRR